MKANATPLTTMIAQSAKAASLMKALSNEHRLLILCHLIENDEMSVGELVSRVGLSQSALSQHLSKLRQQGLVAFRRDAQSLFYRVCDDRAASVLLMLHEMFCSDGKRSVVRKSRMAPPPSQRKNASAGD